MKYEKPELEIVLFQSEDVIRTSPEGSGDGERIEDF